MIERSRPFNILFLSSVEPVAVWRGPLTAALPAENFIWQSSSTRPEQVDVALVTRPDPGALARCTNLKLMHSLWMGVEDLIADETLPRAVPLVRTIDPYMVRAMTESVIAHVLAAHLHHDDFARQQRTRTWRQHSNIIAPERRVGILGLGELGRNAAQALHELGFAVHGWSRSAKRLQHVTAFTGAEELGAFLRAVEILVCLLPLTHETTALLNAKLLAQLPVGAVLINLARGPLVVEEDLLRALDSGQLRHAILDVFNEEPLPASHPFWTHERITVTPHVAAVSYPRSAASFIAENLRRLRAGEPLLGLVDRARGY